MSTDEINRFECRFMDDFHLHLRDNTYLISTISESIKTCQRAIIMPNLQPPVTNTELAKQYKIRIENVINSLGINNISMSPFLPLMTLYLTSSFTAKEIEIAHQSGIVKAVKFYPQGATSYSTHGIPLNNYKSLLSLRSVFEKMSELRMPLLIHGEVTDKNVDIFDRESEFINQFLKPLTEDFPNLKIVLEHITTRDAVDFIQSCNSPNLAATVTAHHLLVNRNSIFENGINPHYYCLPIIKAEPDRVSLIEAVTSSSNENFFAGSDSAPHTIQNKEKCCGCAGCYTGVATMELYAQAFYNEGKLRTKQDWIVFEKFISENGAKFYNLPLNEQKVILRKQDWIIPEQVPFGKESVKPFWAGKTLNFKLEHRNQQYG